MRTMIDRKEFYMDRATGLSKWPIPPVVDIVTRLKLFQPVASACQNTVSAVREGLRER